MGSTLQSAPRQPLTGQIVTVERLAHYQPVDASAFSGLANPSVIWQQMLANPWAAMKFYRDIEEKDAVVAALLEVRKDGVLRRAHQVVAASDAPEDKARADFLIEALGRLPAFGRVLDDLMDAPAFGLTIGEILWEEAEGHICIRDIQAVPQEFFSFGPRFDSAQAGPLIFIGQFGTESREVPEHKFVVFTFRPRNGNRWGRPLLRASFWDSWAARQITKFMLQHSEKGNGTVAVKYPQGASDDERRKALEAAQAIFDEPAVAISENLQIEAELLEKARTGSVPDYLARLDHLYAKLTRRILGQTLTTQGAEQGAGSRALGEVHQDTFLSKVIADAERLERVVNEQIVRPLMVFNFGPGVPLPRWETDKSEPVDQQRLVTIYRQLAELGVRIRLPQVRRQFGLEEVEPGDGVLASPAAPPTTGVA